MISFISYSYYNLWKQKNNDFFQSCCLRFCYYKDHIFAHQVKEKILRILTKKNFNDIQVRGKST